MNKLLWANLGIGGAVGGIALLSGALNLPLSIAAGFVSASVLNMLIIGFRS